jgi:maltose alpha-D-glucosyltransferase / alpha-amylase
MMHTHDDPLWFKDAIIYQVHVKTFCDANGDGVGDFQGLISRLDYLQDLGVNALWIMPFFPSPLRDDGYDIADYRTVNPAYGTMDDFQRFVVEAHARGMRVVIELVINHTSDQHPWFERARNAPEGSVERDFYVWSDTDTKWPETRIIFRDFETSNWTWDPVAGQFFWHRFYSHQPDLNYDNPEVMREVIDAMNYWLDMGVDGLRLDAIPYLVERDGTSNENNPETHTVIKTLRRAIDSRYTGRMLLAEANMWPEETMKYFGDSDECHMSFHFPLMPRLYMALAMEDRHPITDILRQTPTIPDSAQWAIFLRNHDELTLEMVTERERQFMWDYYAADTRYRINQGIRRRLAPLMGGDRRKIELMHGLLFSMPGTPVMYYGDEIGMGDTILEDRHGVRTPMQWAPIANAGFSVAPAEKLYLPVIEDPVYGYQVVNVASQRGRFASQLEWTRRMIAVRQKLRHLFGRGSLTVIDTDSRQVMAYVREYDGASILCVANVSPRAQAVGVSLGAFAGRVPVELNDGAAFPAIAEGVYRLTLAPYAFQWFRLCRADSVGQWAVPGPALAPDFVTVLPSRGWSDLAPGTPYGGLLAEAARAWLARRGGAAAAASSSALATLVPLQGELGNHALAVVDFLSRDGSRQRVALPLTLRWDPGAAQVGWPMLEATICKARRVANLGAVVHGAADPRTIELFAAAAVNGVVLENNGHGVRPLADAVMGGTIELLRPDGFTETLVVDWRAS